MNIQIISLYGLLYTEESLTLSFPVRSKKV